jgi:hypothetical protein
MRLVYSRKGPTNSAERKFLDQCKAPEVQKRGWPDFLCYNGDEIICVEVKPAASHPLKVAQYRLMKSLAKYGVPCYKWSPDGGYKSIEDIGEDRI